MTLTLDDQGRATGSTVSRDDCVLCARKPWSGYVVSAEELCQSCLDGMRLHAYAYRAEKEA